MKDPRIAKYIRALTDRFPGTIAVTRPMCDGAAPGEVAIDLLNAPVDPPMLVYEFAREVIEELWGDDPHTAFVSAISPEQSAKNHAKELADARRARVVRRRRRAAPRKRASAR